MAKPSKQAKMNQEELDRLTSVETVRKTQLNPEDPNPLLKSLWESKLWSDVIIRIGHDEENIIKAHKCIICKAIPYFAEKFASNNCPSSLKVITIEEYTIDAQAMETAIAYVYTIGKDLTSFDIVYLTKAAMFLGLNELVETCKHLLAPLINLGNVFELKSLAERVACIPILTSTRAYLSVNFDSITRSQLFLKLTVEELTELLALGSQGSSDQNQEKIFETIKKWIKFDIRRRRGQLSTLLEQHIRLEGIDSTKLLATFLDDELVQSNKDAVKFLVDAMKKKIMQPELEVSSPATPASKSSTSSSAILSPCRNHSVSKPLTRSLNLIPLSLIMKKETGKYGLTDVFVKPSTSITKS